MIQPETAPPRSGSHARAPADPHEPLILLIDDQPARLLTYESILEGVGVRCVRALSGDEALNRLLHDRFALILLDVNMPGMDGFDTARLIRQHPRFEHTPIIFVTGVHLTDLDALKGYEAGAIDYIPVPVVPEILRSKVALLVELYRRRFELERLNDELSVAHARVQAERDMALHAADAGREHEWLSAVLDNISDEVYFTDTAGRYTYANPAARQELRHGFSQGIPVSDVLGRLEVYRADGSPRPIEEAPALRALDGEIIRHEEQIVRHPRTGALHHRQESAAPVRDATGLIVGSVSIARDISEIRLHEQKVRELEREHGELLDISSDAILLREMDGAIQYWNRGAADLYGFERDEAVGRSSHTLLATPGDQISEFTHALQRAGTWRGDLSHTTKGGRKLTVQGAMQLVRRGHQTLVMESNRDRTDQKAMEERERRHQLALKEKSDELQHTLLTAATGLTRCSRDLRYLSVNPAYAAIVGRRVKDILGRPIAEVIGEIGLEAIRPQIERVLSGEVVRYDMAVPYAGGSVRHVEAVYAPWKEADGSISGWVASVNDISQRKAAERALAQERALLETLIGAAPVGFCLLDPQSRFVMINQRLADMHGLTVEKHIGKTVGECLPAIDPPMRGMVARVLQSDEPELGVELSWQSPGSAGLLRCCSVSCYPVHSADGAIRHIAVMVEETTERKIKEAELETHISALKEAEHRKDEFLALLAHELRNPLAPVRYAAAMLRPDVSAEVIAKARATIERQLAHLARLLDDLLDVSRITRGVVTLKLESIDLRLKVREAVEVARPEAEARGHVLSLCLADKPVWVRADGDRLTQIVGNLLSNAVKFTPPNGSIVVRVEAQGANAGVSVEDSGIGFPPELAPKLFELFALVGDGSKPGNAGLGIGLNVVQRLVALHGGEVEARSPGYGRGSTFRVRLPLRTATGAKLELADAARAADQDPGGLRLLIVDDNVAIVESLAIFLSAEGQTVHAAHTGQEALQRAQDVSPHIVFLDIGLPDMTGFEVAKALRRKQGGRKLLIVAVSGWATEADRQMSRQSGIDMHLAKPVDPLQLLQIIETATRTR